MYNTATSDGRQPDMEEVRRERKKEQNRIAQRNYRINQRKRIHQLEMAAAKSNATSISQEKSSATIPSNSDSHAVVISPLSYFYAPTQEINQPKMTHQLENDAAQSNAVPVSKSPTTKPSSSDSQAVVISPLSDFCNPIQDIAPVPTTSFAADDPGCDDLPIWHHNSTSAETPPLSTDFPANLGQSQTPLHLAIRNGNESMAKFLLKRGADITLRDSNGSTSLHFAAESCHENLVKLVLGEFPDPNQTDYMGRTALFVAVQKENEAIAKLLLDASVDVNLKDMWDNTALHIAVEKNSEALAIVLLANGANIDV